MGTALARSYASAGRTLILHGRAQERLTALSESCRALGARVLQMTFDLRDTDTTVRELRSISQHESIDLVIVNAGVTKMIGDGEQVESIAVAREVLSVNLDGGLAYGPRGVTCIIAPCARQLYNCPVRYYYGLAEMRAETPSHNANLRSQ